MENSEHQKNQNIEDTFLKTINNGNALKIIGYPTGMGKTYGAAESSNQKLSSEYLSIFIAPRIAILDDFTQTIIEAHEKSSSEDNLKIVQVKSDTELKSSTYYRLNESLFNQIKRNIEKDFFRALQNTQYSKMNSSDIEEINNKKIKSSNDKMLYKTWEAVKQILKTNNLWHKHKDDLQFLEVKNLMDIHLEKNFLAIIQIFHFSYSIVNTNINHLNETDSKIAIKSFESIGEKIIEDFFGLTFALNDIQHQKEKEKKGDGNNGNKKTHYAIVLASQKVIRYITRHFSFEAGKIKKIIGNKDNNLTINVFINTFCKANSITPIYYIDEADEFYNVIVDLNTKETYLDNFLFRIKSFLDYSNISSLISFLNKSEKYIGKNTEDVKSLFYSLNFDLGCDIISNFYSFFKSSHIRLSVDYKLSKSETQKIKQKMEELLFDDESFLETFSRGKTMQNPEQCLFLFFCYIDGIGAYSKIQKNLSDDKKQKEPPLFIEDLKKSLRNYKQFLIQWDHKKHETKMNHKRFFEYLNLLQSFLIDSNHSEIIVGNLDFAELSDNTKFMFGNNQLSLVESQFKYLDSMVASETPSNNIRISKKTEKFDDKDIQLSFLYGFLTKVLIMSIKSFSFPNDKDIKENPNNDTPNSMILDNEFNTRRYLRAMKKAFSDVSDSDNSVFQLSDEELYFDDNYIFKDSKNIINIFTCDYEDNLKYGKDMNSSYIKMNNINIKTSPEDEILSFFSTQNDSRINIPFSSKSVVFLMSATSMVNSYFGNFDIGYIREKLEKNGITFQQTFTERNDIAFSKKKNEIILNHTNNGESITPIIKILSNSPHDTGLAKYISSYIRKNEIPNFDIYKDSKAIYKVVEFERFIESISILHNTKNNSMFFVSQTSRYIKTFLEHITRNDHTQNKSPNGIFNKFLHESNNQKKFLKNIYFIDKDNLNEDISVFDKEHKPLDKDIIIIFYDSTFNNNQKETIIDINKEIFNALNNLDSDEENDGTIEESEESTELNIIQKELHSLKREIFNEKKYKVLLCSTFGSVSKGFNFVTNLGTDEQGKLIEKDFDSLNIAVDPHFDNITAEPNKTRNLAFQRILAIKDFNHKYSRPGTLEEINRHFYVNKHNLIRKEHLAHIARTIIQIIGRIERRRFNLSRCKRQTIYINQETYNKMKEFYQLYDYERQFNGYFESSIAEIERKVFCSNLSVNNQTLFNKINEERTQDTIFQGECLDFKQYKQQQIDINGLLEEIVKFILLEVRRNPKINKEFPIIWDSLKSINFLNNFPEYLKKLKNTEHKIYELAKKYGVKEKYPLLDKWIFDNNRKSFEDIFFVKFKKDSQVGFMEVKNQDNNFIDIITDEYHANNSLYNINLLVFSIKKIEISPKDLHFIPINLDDENSIKNKLTIGDISYYPQKKIAFEFLKTAISEEILKKVLIHYKITFFEKLNHNDRSYEIYDIFIPHKDNKYSAIDVKFWSKATQALNSKNIEIKDENKHYVLDLSNIKNRIYLNIFGLLEDGIENNGIYYKSLFVKTTKILKDKKIEQYEINPNFIEFLKNEIKNKGN